MPTALPLPLRGNPAGPPWPPEPRWTCGSGTILEVTSHGSVRKAPETASSGRTERTAFPPGRRQGKSQQSPRSEWRVLPRPPCSRLPACNLLRPPLQHPSAAGPQGVKGGGRGPAGKKARPGHPSEGGRRVGSSSLEVRGLCPWGACAGPKGPDTCRRPAGGPRGGKGPGVELGLCSWGASTSFHLGKSVFPFLRAFRAPLSRQGQAWPLAQDARPAPRGIVCSRFPHLLGPRPGKPVPDPTCRGKRGGQGVAGNTLGPQGEWPPGIDTCSPQSGPFPQSACGFRANSEMKSCQPQFTRCPVAQACSLRAPAWPWGLPAPPPAPSRALGPRGHKAQRQRTAPGTRGDGEDPSASPGGPRAQKAPTPSIATKPGRFLGKPPLLSSLLGSPEPS